MLDMFSDLKKVTRSYYAAIAPITMCVPAVKPMIGSKSMVRLQRDRLIDSK
jgi:hypothetical protein